MTSAIHTGTSALDPQRRSLTLLTVGIGGVGFVATCVPFISSLGPSELAKALGGSVTVSLDALSEEKFNDGRVARHARVDFAPICGPAGSIVPAMDRALIWRDACSATFPHRAILWCRSIVMCPTR